MTQCDIGAFRQANAAGLGGSVAGTECPSISGHDRLATGTRARSSATTMSREHLGRLVKVPGRVGIPLGEMGEHEPPHPAFRRDLGRLPRGEMPVPVGELSILGEKRRLDHQASPRHQREHQTASHNRVSMTNANRCRAAAR